MWDPGDALTSGLRLCGTTHTLYQSWKRKMSALHVQSRHALWQALGVHQSDTFGLLKFARPARASAQLHEVMFLFPGGW